MITRGGDKMSYKSSRKLLENCLKICIKPQLREHLGSSIKTRELQTILVHGKCRSSLVHFVNDALARIAHSSTQTMIMHVSMNRLIESRNSLVNMFKVASKMNPCIICFEDIDRFMNDSELPKLVGNLARLFDQFIDFVHELEGDNDNEDIVIIGITNLVNSLHPSISRLFRTGIHVPEPSADERYRFLSNEIPDQYDGHCMMIDDRDIRYLANVTENYSLADLRTIVEQACINNNNDNNSNDVDQYRPFGLTLEMLLESKEKIAPS